ncbi:KPN_02809 family neutral zinc metallopeptidase [Pseudomonas sp. JZ134]|uniref:KPN_02809 family neutral zinc metallopeptidase n=1 Tax=Pseudomonas sp. JZ134 TaxID=2806615 RepID=UPI003DA17315
MDWGKGRRSDNVEQATGGGRGLQIGGGLGVGGVLLVVVFSLVTGQDPLQVLSMVTGSGGGAQVAQQTQAPDANSKQVDFVRAILGDTEDTWGEIFAAHGEHYQQPKLILFNGHVQSACGSASAATGPFYCPADQQVYLDLSFFDEMERRFSAAGDFARAYVIAHEIGHHVQDLVGTTEKMQAAERRGMPAQGAQGLSVRLELQADCYAGVWANHAQKRLHWLEPGDLEEAINAAHAIGDNRLQEQAQGRAVPDSFTHGTSEQRARWFRTGFDNGAVERCDTFTASRL